MNQKHASIGKFLSFILRHKPEDIGLTLDREGWANIDLLIKCAASKGKRLHRHTIQEIVDNNDKKRFEISANGLCIRAVQGHSTASVDRTFPEVVLPEILYHGTATSALKSIKNEGLIAGSRQYVHLSLDEKTAIHVGRRHGKPTALKIAALEMHQQGFKFFLAENGVWLTEHVPIEYIKV